MVNIKLKTDVKEINSVFIDDRELSLYKSGILSLPHLVIRKGSNVRLETFVDKNGSYYIRAKEGSMVREFNCKLYINKNGLCEDIFYLEKSETREKQVGIRDEIVDFNGTHECFFYSSANNKFRSEYWIYRSKSSKSQFESILYALFSNLYVITSQEKLFTCSGPTCQVEL